MTFRLTTLMYLFALVAAALAAFGTGGGILAVIGVLVFWAIAIDSWRTALFLLAFGLTLLALALLPNVPRPHMASPLNRCRNNIKQLLLSTENYHDTHGLLPPAVGIANGQRAAQSWRVHILPFIEGNTVAYHYNFDEPWDSPKNAKLIGPIGLEEFECPVHDAPTETAYFAITGPQTAWGDGEPHTLDDVADGLGNTILLVEAAGRGVHWAEPKDLSFDEAVELLTTPLPASGGDGHRVYHGYFFKPSYVRNVGMCDGSSRTLPMPLPREAAVALLTANGGEEIDPQWTESYPKPQLDYGRVWGFSLFVVLAVLPGVPKLRPWIWPTITSSAEVPTTNPPDSPLEQ